MLSTSGKPFTVTEISTLVRNCLEEKFGVVEVEGEITDYRGANTSGHHYFSLKDAQSRISVVLFAGNAIRLRMRLDNGKKVRVAGRLTSYSGTSRYQIIAASVVETGVGDLAARFEELKRRLAEEGLFDEDRKRPLPLLPRHVGVVTSPTGSVIRDFVNVLTRRYPNIDILVCPARVQGEGAAEEIASGIRLLCSVGCKGSGVLEGLPQREVIVVMRGGGSMEELWCFNEEIVARAVAESPVPVISGVGHQTDFTICDFAADVRAPTPSAAAELLVRPKADFLQTLSSASQSLENALGRRLDVVRARLDSARKNRVFSEPGHLVENLIQRIDGRMRSLDATLAAALSGARAKLDALGGALSVRQAAFMPAQRAGLEDFRSRMRHAASSKLERMRAELASHSRQLAALSPFAVLDRGYSLTVLEDGSILRTAAQARPGARLTTRLSGGQEVASTVDGAGAPAAGRTFRRKAAAPDGGQLTLF